MKPKTLLFVGVTLSGLLLTVPAFCKQKHSAKQPAKQVQVQPIQAAPPPTLAQTPPTPPQVSFQGGQLTISAQNSTLGDILKAVRAQTNANIEVPGNAPDRVVGQFGPGPARDVLTSLLNGTHFNYLLLGSSSDPNALDRVILMAKSGGTGDSPQPPSPEETAYNQRVISRPTSMPMAAPGGNTTVVEGQEAQDDSADDSADSADDTQADETTEDSDQSDQTDDQQAGEETQQQNGQNGQPNVKTPEQLLQQLQQRQQQIQQQGGQPGAPGFPNPALPPGPPHN